MQWCGTIGFVVTEETKPGIFNESITERKYYGDILQFTKREQQSESINDNRFINNRLSIIADPFCMNNFQNIKYVKFMGSKWKIGSVDIEYPRLIFSFDAPYNEEADDENQ